MEITIRTASREHVEKMIAVGAAEPGAVVRIRVEDDNPIHVTPKQARELAVLLNAAAAEGDAILAELGAKQ